MHTFLLMGRLHGTLAVPLTADGEHNGETHPAAGKILGTF